MTPNPLTFNNLMIAWSSDSIRIIPEDTGDRFWYRKVP